jgi:ABC-type polar amino acid transport system ATPase subunit
MIELEHVSKWFGATRVLDDCSAQIGQGEVVVVCGPSGSGKSTLIRTVNALEPIQQGRVRVDGVDVHAPGTDLAALRARVGMVFQHFELFPHLPVLDNLVLAPMRVLGRTREQAVDAARGQLARVGLAGLEERYPRHLSGGQQQRVAIARALAMEPRVLLVDEPTSALDPEAVGDVLALVGELAQDGLTMLVVTHEMGFARRAAGRVLFMDAGRIVEDAPAAAFFERPGSGRARAFLARLLH